MSWLFPLYLAGAVAVIAPILLHLRRQPPKDRVAFSSLMFLEETERQPTRRRRLENWLLLVARCLILLLLALMFARPFWRGAGDLGADDGETVVILVDRSASMRRGELWAQARELAKSVVAEAASGDRVAVGVFDDEVAWLWTLAEDGKEPGARSGVVASRLAEAKAGWGATDLGGAMVAAVNAIGEQAAGQGRLVLVSDFQEGARVEALQKVVWPEGVEVERRVVRLADEENGNLTLGLVAERDNEGEVNAAEPVRRVRVSSTLEAQETAFEVGWESARGSASGGPVIQGYLPPGSSRVLKMPPRPAGEEGAGVLRLTGDRFDFDNRVHVAPSEPREVRVWVAADAAAVNEASSPAYYLQRALQPTAAIRPVLVPVSGEGWRSAEGAAVLVAPGAGVRLGAAGVAGWRAALERGRLGIYVADGAGAAEELAMLVPEVKWSVSEAARGGQEEYVMLGELETGHRLLQPFADERLRDFTKVRFWRHRVVGAEGERVQVLARFDSGDPAMLVVRVGEGNLLVLASGWHPADSQLALSTKFVPLWFGWLASVGFGHQEETSLEVGQALPGVFQNEGEVAGPDGKVERVAPGGTAVAREPGIYRVKTGQEERQFAVQVPAAEGRVSVMDEGRLSELGVRLRRGGGAATTAVASTAEERERLDGVATEAQQRVWWWTLLAVLALLLGETWLSGQRREAVTA